MNEILDCDGMTLAERSFPFTDKRLTDLLFRYRGRNFPDSLSADELDLWQEFCHQRVHEADGGGSITAADCLARIKALPTERELSADKLAVLAALEAHVRRLP
jgi:exodeoxyribonuclease-1